MSEWDNPVFDEVAERMESKEQKRVNCGKDLLVDPQTIDSIKVLRKYLCNIAVPSQHKGMPRVSSCKTCQSQCGYGRRLIELVSANIQLAAEKKAEKREQAAELPAATDLMTAADREDRTMCAVHLTASQCCNIAEFIELYLLRVIREDDEIDNLKWVEDMIGAMNALKNAGGVELDD